MNRNFYWKLAIVIVCVAWALYELYPPTGRDVTVEFQRLAVRHDAAYTNITRRLQELQQQNPDRRFANLLDAVGTNSLERYFPMFPEARAEQDPTRYIVNRIQREAAGKIKLGLDLQGGTSFLVAMETNTLAMSDTNAIIAEQKKEHALAQAVEVLRKRVDKFGVAEPIIQPAGSDRILIQLPGLSEADKEAAMRQIQRAAFLEFRLVHANSKELIDAGAREPGYEVMREERKLPNGTKEVLPYLVQKKAIRGLTGKYLTRAYVSRNPMSNQPVINFEMNNEGARIFGDVTEQNVGRQLAIILDGVLYSAPVIKTAILGGSGVIEGDFTIEQAQELANVLQNPLEAPVKIIESREVDPSLGKDSIRSGITAAIAGTVAVAGFMLVYYMFAGLVANLALVTNIIILLGVMCYIRTTLTLPGIAGVVLTVGMAVDANVLIFERIREELGKGKSLRGALIAGYDRAFGTIFDSHVTTLISSIILIFMGTGSIKGFGVALTIGVAASLFTALVVTRLIFDFMIYKGWLKSMPMLHVIRAVKIDFMKLAKPAFIASWTLIVIGLAYGLLARGDKMMGIDFAGGDELTLRFAQNHKVEVDALRKTLADAGIVDPQIQYQKDLAARTETLRITSKYNTGNKVQTLLQEKFPPAGFTRAALDNVGPTIGGEIKQSALIAALLSLFGILVYIAFRYEFSFAVGAVLAVFHDVFMTIGCYCLTGLWGPGREFNTTTVAAILTIIGFSTNDTIVIFDRIREDLKLGVRGTFKEVINQALNQTLSRTIITSGTVFLATMSLYLFGGGAINDFAFTFLVGIITGTYSSIYIASALVLWWHKGERPAIGSQAVPAPEAPPAAPAPARA